MQKSLLFVCLGNICRSPLAEGIARKLAQEYRLELKIDSAGVSSWHINEKPCKNSIAIAREFGIDISTLRGRQVEYESDREFDYILAMDRQNLEDLLELGFSKDKTFLVGDFGLDGASIPDPYHYRELEGFYKIYEMLEECISCFLKQTFKKW